ncbi:MAG: hypothetical protein ACOX9C_12385 [Kiritimatiellia bacterium]
MKIEDFRIRAPFVLPDKGKGVCHLFGTTDTNARRGKGTGFDCYTTDA